MEKQFLFVTDDGIDIHEGERYFTVSVVESEIHESIRRFFKEKFNRELPKVQPAGVIAGPYINRKWYDQTGILKYFAKRENAEKFVKENIKNEKVN